MYVWRKTEVCSCDRRCSGKAISITQPECVYVCRRCLACNVHVLGYFVIESRILISIMALVFCFLFVLWYRRPQNTPFGLPGVMDEIWTRYLQSRNLMLLLHQWVWWYNLRKSQQQLKLSLNTVGFLCVLQSFMKIIVACYNYGCVTGYCNCCIDYELFNMLLCHYTSSGCMSA